MIAQRERHMITAVEQVGPPGWHGNKQRETGVPPVKTGETPVPHIVQMQPYFRAVAERNSTSDSTSKKVQSSGTSTIFPLARSRSIREATNHPVVPALLTISNR